MEPPPIPAAAAASPERLFDSHRLPSDGPLPLLLALLLYAPVGLCLLLVRLFVGLHVFLVSCALPDGAPRRFLVRAMCSVLGLFVWQSRPRSARARVLVANHVTPFDHNVLGLLASCSAPVLNGGAGFVCWSRGFLEVAGAESRAELLESLKGYCSQGGNPPLLLFPEEATTNGRVGLLRFSSWPFSIVDAVQPLALRVWRPFVAVSVAGASWVTELLWTLFVPVTIYQVRWLPSVYRQAEETQEEFALRVQELLALELGVVSTCLTAADKAEHLKRLRHHPTASRPPPQPSQPSGGRPQVSRSMASTEDVQLIGMARRVREVLPQVPMAAIRKDLAQTNCVDTTIANLLEGRVPFVPEAETEGFVAAAPSFYGAQDPSTSRMSPASGKVFARSAEARQLSLQERKQALWDYARRKYTEKYGIAHVEGSC
ncbi:lipid droplet-regulating VLDL assembly factor AUP1 isoform X2 [Ahaetulla prasina]|uniref:lipid droplet-regulating VLDL assembly factor AUP1 isoform X2 n=1 Tax=Ahaetulla prasina TaxID=499056 RepID=UPI00264A2F1D|nr:lipid droplet-regulating VLDL assembly factor AUP1 isoform X2 [Ahaetulla prasina]